MNKDKVVEFDKLLDVLFTNIFRRFEENVYAKLDNDKKLDVRTADICLAIMEGIIDDILDKGEE